MVSDTVIKSWESTEGQAGLVGNFTNHSGKRTCATQLYQAGMDEQEIMSRTGQCSEMVVRKYQGSNSVLMETVESVGSAKDDEIRRPTPSSDHSRKFVDE